MNEKGEIDSSIKQIWIPGRIGPVSWCWNVPSLISAMAPRMRESNMLDSALSFLKCAM